jgi:hypothetical protein
MGTGQGLEIAFFFLSFFFANPPKKNGTPLKKTAQGKHQNVK